MSFLLNIPYANRLNKPGCRGVADASSFGLSVVTLHMEYAVRKLGDVRVRLFDERPLRVESAVAELFEALGFEAYRGVDVYAAGLVLKPRRRRSRPTFDAHTAMSQPQIYIMFRDFIDAFPDVTDRWRQWLSARSALANGVPDLFLWNRLTGDWFWAEVKSQVDHLRPEQWDWIESFQDSVSPNVLVVRVLPADYPTAPRHLSDLIIVRNDVNEGTPSLRCGLKVAYVLNELALGRSEGLIGTSGLTMEEIEAAREYAYGPPTSSPIRPLVPEAIDESGVEDGRLMIEIYEGS